MNYSQDLATVLNLLVDQSAGKIAIQVATANILIESIPIPEVDQLGNATESASQGMSVASYTNEVNAIREGIVLETKDGCNIGGPAISPLSRIARLTPWRVELEDDEYT